METLSQRRPLAVIAILGSTGSGKSTFVKLLTNDENIRIGHSQESETSEIQISNYVDERTGHSAILVDTPGFDDSREEITDTDILEQIVQFLEPRHGVRRILNGIIYLHRISDPRITGSSKKNIRMLHALCGEESLKHVCILTTNWNRVTEREGSCREAELERTAFKPFVDAGARIHRHTNSVESARRVVSDLMLLPPVTLQLQKELDAGKKLTDTLAGRVLTERIREMERKHEREMDRLKFEMELAANANNRALRAEFEQERKLLEEKMERASVDQKRLQRTLAEHHRAAGNAWRHERELSKLLMTHLSLERHEMMAQLARTTDYELLLGELTNPKLSVAGENCHINSLISETAVLQRDIAKSKARCTFLERSLTALQWENEALLRQNAVPAMDALLLLVNHIESLHQVTRRHEEMSAPMNDQSIFRTIQAFQPLAYACKLQSRAVFDRFRSLSEHARELTQRFTELTVDLTYEVTMAQERLEKLRNMMQVVEVLRRGIDEERNRWDEQKAASQAHIERARETIRSAERKRDSMESSRVIRNILTLGLGEVFDFFDLNEEIKNTEQTVESAEQHVRACEQSIQQAILALSRISDEIAHLGTLGLTVETQEATLQTSVMHGQALRTRTIDLTNASLDVSLVVGKLAATSETFAVHHTAQEFARGILNFGKIVASEGRLHDLLVVRNSDELQETLKMIAQSDGENSIWQGSSVTTQRPWVSVEDMM